jgi:hypothetical protein
LISSSDASQFSRYGREPTANEYRRLFDEAGFEMVGVVDTASRFSVIEGRPV